MKLKFNSDKGFNISTSIGELFIDTMKVGVLDELSSITSESNIKELPYYKKVLSLIAKRNENKELLSIQDIDKLTIDDFAKIAISFLEHNPYLLERINRDKTLDKNDVNPADFLEETLREYLKKEIEDFDKFIKRQNPFKDLFKNNELINKLYSNNYNISKQLGEAIKNISSSTSSIENLQYLKPAPHHALETNTKMQIIIDQITEIKPVFLDSARLIKNLNDLVLEILNNFIKNTLSSIKYNRIMLIIAMSALIISTVFSLLSYFDNREANSSDQIYQQQFIEETYKFNKAQQKMNNSLSRIQELLKEQNELLRSNKLYPVSIIDSIKKLNKKNSNLLKK